MWIFVPTLFCPSAIGTDLASLVSAGLPIFGQDGLKGDLKLTEKHDAGLQLP